MSTIKLKGELKRKMRRLEALERLTVPFYSLNDLRIFRYATNNLGSIKGMLEECGVVVTGAEEIEANQETGENAGFNLNGDRPISLHIKMRDYIEAFLTEEGWLKGKLFEVWDDIPEENKNDIDLTKTRYWNVVEVVRSMRQRGVEISVDLYDFINEFLESKSTLLTIPRINNAIKKRRKVLYCPTKETVRRVIRKSKQALLNSIKKVQELFVLDANSNIEKGKDR